MSSGVSFVIINPFLPQKNRAESIITTRPIVSKPWRVLQKFVHFSRKRERNHCLVPTMTPMSLAVIALLVRAGRNGAETYSKSIMSDSPAGRRVVVKV